MLATLPKANGMVSVYAPKIKMVKVPVEKIGEVIGPGGRMIKKIIAETGAEVEVEDDGTVNISGIDASAVDQAVARVESLVKEVKAGEIYEGEVKRIQPFGAFIEVLPGKEGMVHVSDMSEGFVSDPNTLLKLGDKVQVRVKEIDDLGRINLSMLMDPSKDKEKTERRSEVPRRSFGDRPRRYDNSRGGNRFDDKKSFGGPHFPRSRFISTPKKDFGR
jgi:polyribonucleotide nucleotidyltransferase